MDSDIDIVEHDLFENPELRLLFPNLIEIKKEIYNDGNIEDFEIENCDQTTLKVKPSLGVLKHSQDNDIYNQQDVETKHAMQQKTSGCKHKNKIIIGSKTKHLPLTSNNNMKHTISKQVKIIVTDLKATLLNSNRFCKLCSILFLNNSNLIDHRNIVHGEKYICDKCDKSFCQQGNLTRHLKNVHKTKVNERKRIKLAENAFLENVQAPNVECFHCRTTFESNQSLIEHLYMVLKPKIKRETHLQYNPIRNGSDHEIGEKNRSAVKRPLKNDKTGLLFRCHKCLYYFKSMNFFLKHMKMKHQIQDFPIKRVPFNPKCHQCKRDYGNVNLYNHHMRNHHQSLAKKLKMVRVNFKRQILAKKGTNHKTMNVFILKDYVFKCPKCHLLFLSSSEALNHIEHSEYKCLWKCSNCQLTFQRKKGKHQLWQHTCSKSVTTIEINDGTFDKILYSCSKCSVHYREQQFIEHYAKCDCSSALSEHCDICDILIDYKLKMAHRDIHDAYFKDKTDFWIMEPIEKARNGPTLAQSSKLKNKLYYCKTCQCYLAKRHNIHCQSRCSKSEKQTCVLCGLTFTNKGFRGHNSVHRKYPTVKLQDFKFYDLETCATMNPPVPEFQKCEGCNKHLLNKYTLKSHLCGVGADFRCWICDMKCSEIVLRLHLPFHEYDINRTDIKNLRAIGNGLKVTNNVCSPMENEDNVNKPVIDTDVYCCKICFKQIHSYDDVIEHCHLHVLNQGGLVPNIDRLKPHMCSHSNACGSRVYHFEPYYFGCKDDIWLKHVFNGLSRNEISKKLLNSIYRFEKRIKLHIVEEGSPEHTEYKCEKCQRLVESSTLFSHVDRCRGSDRSKYSCLVCNNAYTSQMALRRHSTLHSLHIQHVRKVSFNRESDQRINKLIQLNGSQGYYVVFRCRNCDGVVKETDFSRHVCDCAALRKCNHCGLLLYATDYESHLLKHKNLNSFTGSNMKVILLGDAIPGFKRSSLVTSSFMGIVCDYSFHKCAKCDVCIRSARHISKHFCLVKAAKAKCELCDLYFEQGKLKAHKKLHSEDPEFVKSHISINIFKPKESQENKSKSKCDLNRSANTDVVKIII